MTDVNQSEWADNFKRISDTPPAPGTVLQTQDDSPVKLTVELTAGQSPFIFGRAYVPDLFGQELGWYLQSAENKSYHGWKCVLLPKARVSLIQKIGLGEEVDGETTILVKSLKVIRTSHSGNSLLCEVHEYLEDTETETETETEELVRKDYNVVPAEAEV